MSSSDLAEISALPLAGIGAPPPPAPDPRGFSHHAPKPPKTSKATKGAEMPGVEEEDGVGGSGEAVWARPGGYGHFTGWPCFSAFLRFLVVKWACGPG